LGSPEGGGPRIVRAWAGVNGEHIDHLYLLPASIAAAFGTKLLCRQKKLKPGKKNQPLRLPVKAQLDQRLYERHGFGRRWGVIRRDGSANSRRKPTYSTVARIRCACAPQAQHGSCRPRH